MSFLSREMSIDSAKPIELYHIKTGLRDWYFTSGRKDFTYLLNVYEAVTMKRSAIQQAREYAKATLQVTVPGTLEFAQLFLRDPPEGLVRMTIYRTHEGDSEVSTYWDGRVTGISFDGPQAVIRAEPVYTTLRSQGRRKTYSTQCNWTLYRFGCNVNDQAFKATGTLSGVSGATLSSAAFGTQPSGYFAGGKVVVWVNDEPYNRRVDSHDGTTVVMNNPVPGLAGGGAVEIFPGCDHGYGTCISKFNNSINYGGFPWKPRKDPFSGGSPF